MKYILLTMLVVTLGVVCPLQAQYTTVKYDAVNNWFNQGQPLPAETDLVFTGPVGADIDRIELSFLDAKHNEVLYRGNWRRTANEADFSLPVSYKLRSDDMYDVKLTYFGKAGKIEVEQLRQQVQAGLETLFEVHQKQANSIEFKGNPRRLVRDMNALMVKQLTDYRVRADHWSPMLSELVELKLQQMEQVDLDYSYQRQDTSQTKTDVRNAARTEYISDFKQLLGEEIEAILDNGLYRMRDSRIVEDYRTEKTSTVLSLSVGYGGVYLSGKWTDGQYGSAPYAGVAIPLGNRVLGKKFFRNVAINTGVFLSKLDDGNGQEVTGFLIDQPIYVGLDYKLFQFIHLNAGTVLINGNTLNDIDVQIGNQQLAFRPFVGLSARINLRLGLSN